MANPDEAQTRPPGYTPHKQKCAISRRSSFARATIDAESRSLRRISTDRVHSFQFVRVLPFFSSLSLQVTEQVNGNIEVLPYERSTVSYEFLSQLVGEYLLLNCPGIDISAALSIMPTTTKGLDLNPQFTGATDFRPAGDGGELKLFEQAGIKLVHGWLVDPNSPETGVLLQIHDYDSAVNLIAGADHITKGKLLPTEVFADTGEAGPSQAGSSQAGSSSQTGPSSRTPESYRYLY